MKHTTLTIAATLIASAASTYAPRSIADDVCAPIEGSARATMEARQSGVPLSTSIGIANNSGGTKNTKELLTAMVLEAYEQPRYSTERMQQRSVRAFTDDWYLQCLKAHNGK